MKKSLLCLLLLLSSSVLFAAVVDRNTVVVQEDSAIITEKNAAKILADTLGKIFGAEIRVISAGEYDGKFPAILLKSAKLAPEEWCIETTSPDVVTISGGRTLGVLYGTYEFLEKFGKCRYFAPHCLYTPQVSSFSVPDGTRFQRKPAFLRRDLVTPVRNPENAAFNSWNKGNVSFCALNEDRIPIEQEYLYKTARSIGGSCHSLYFWSKDFPADHPEYFSMDSNGQRSRATSAMGPGQLCFSNPDVRRLMKEKVLKLIREDRENAAKYGYLPAATVNITHNDNGSYCVCPECSALLKKYGQYSGVLLDFINDIASCAPDMTFETFAYTFTEEPPQGIQPADNVAMFMAFLGPELMNGKCDTARSIALHPNNEVTRRYIREWGSISKFLTIWLYHRLYRQEFPSPNAMLWNVAPDIRYLRNAGVSRFVIESEYDDLEGEIGPRALHELYEYLVRKILDDPDQDENVLIAEFIAYYYGPAAPEMTEYMNYLHQRMDEEKGMLGKISTHNRSYMDTDFLVTINRLLTKAQEKVAGDPVRSNRVAMELMLVDFAAANMWSRLPDLPQKYALSHEAMLDRLEKNGLIAFEVIKGGPDSGTALAASQKRLKETVQLLRHPLQVPDELKSRKIIQHPVAFFAAGNAVNDPEASGGKALVIGPDAPHDKPVEFGIYKRSEKKNMRKWTIPPEKIAQDEQYHLYYLGSSPLPPPETQPVFWGHWSWQMGLSTSLSAAYSPQDSNRVYDIFVSLKFTGPAYCKNSTTPNEMRLDQIFYAERGDDFAMPQELSGRSGTVYLLNRFPFSTVFTTVVDPDAADSKAVVVPRTKAPMEFGFYDRTLKKKAFQKNFPQAQFPCDGKYHLYSLGTPKMPSLNQKYSFWGHESWNLRLNEVLEEFLVKNDGRKTWEIFVSIKADAKNLYVDRVIFAEVKGFFVGL